MEVVSLPKADSSVCKIQQYIKEVNEVFPGAALERRNGKIGVFWNGQDLSRMHYMNPPKTAEEACFNATHSAAFEIECRPGLFIDRMIA